MFGKNSTLGLFAGVLVLAGCVAEGGGGPGHRPPPMGPGPSQPPQACTMIYKPVCGERHGVRKTFGNECGARAEGFRVVSQGQCSGRPGGDRPGGGWGRPDRPPHQGGRPGMGGSGMGGPGMGGPGMGACTREYQPVCARRGSDRRSFSNSCEAERAGYRVMGGGQCR